MSLPKVTDEDVLAAIVEHAGDGYCLAADVLPSLPKLSHAERRRALHRAVSRGLVIELAKEDLRKLVLTKDLEPLFELEECFAGGTELAASLPHRQKQPLPPVCDQIAKLHPSQSVFGPGTFLYLSVAGIQEALRGQ